MTPYLPCTVCINLETITFISQVETTVMMLLNSIHDLSPTLQIGTNVSVLSLQLHFQIPCELEAMHIVYWKGYS